MKTVFVIMLGAAFTIGGFVGALVEDAIAAKQEVQKQIQWRPADRYQITVDESGNVYKLDRATGDVLVSTPEGKTFYAQ